MADEDAKRLLQRAISRGLITAAAVHETMRRHKAAQDAGAPLSPIEILKEVANLDARALAALDDRSMVGRVLAGFRIDAKLGEGAMGAVFRATQVSLGRTVALKVLDPALACKDEFVERFKREVRAAARLDHPNVVQPIETGEEGGMLFFAMELMEGGSAASRLQKSGQFAERDAIEVGIAVARALEYASEHGIVHRDIKPDNILFSKHGVVKLADLGLVLDTKSDTSLTEPGMTMGTPDYMSPEQAQGMRDLDARSDVYAVGVTLFQLATGRLPFEGPDPLAVALQHVNAPPPDPRGIAPRLSAGFAALVLKTLSKRRDDRHAGGKELRTALETLRARLEAAALAGSREKEEEEAPSLRASTSGDAAPTLAATPHAPIEAVPAGKPTPAPAAPPAPAAESKSGAGAGTDRPSGSGASPLAPPLPPGASAGSGAFGSSGATAAPAAPRPLAGKVFAACAVLVIALLGAWKGGLLGSAPVRLDPQQESEAVRKLRSNLLTRRQPSGAWGANRDWDIDAWTTGQVLSALGTLSVPAEWQREAKCLAWLRSQELKDAPGGWRCQNPPDNVACTEASAWIAIGLALSGLGATGEAEEQAAAAERARLRAMLVSWMTKDGGFESIPAAGEASVRTSGTCGGLLALIVIDAVDDAVAVRRGGRVERDPTQNAARAEPIQRAARWLGITFDRTRCSWTPHPDADGPTAPIVAGVGDACCWVLLEADARLARSRSTMPWEARQAIEDYASNPPPPSTAALLPWTLLGSAAPEQYRFRLPDGARCSLQAVRWVATPARLLLAQRLGSRTDLGKAPAWAAEARRLRARLKDAPAEVENAFTFQVCETLIAANLVAAFPDGDARAGSLYHCIVERGGASPAPGEGR